jgi:hypothetical protein
MKKFLMGLVLMTGIAAGGYAEQYPMDTIIVNFGNNTKIMILVKNREDLQDLKNYDLNKMLGDLSMSVDTLPQGEKYLRLEDNSGTHYLKDTTVVYEDENNTDREGEYEKKYHSLLDEMNNRDNDQYYDKDKKKEHRFNNHGTRNYFNFDFGMNNLLEEGKFPDGNNAQYTVKPWGSWFVGITNINRTHVTGPLYLDWGGGVSWYNFKFQDPATRIEKADAGTIFYSDTSIVNPYKSKLTSAYINAYFVPMFNFGWSGRKKDIFHWSNFDEAFRFGAGFYAGYRIDSYSKNMWKEDDKKKLYRNHDNFYLNNIRYGIRARLGFGSFDFFADYDISELFVDGKGPKLNPISFGVIF